MKQILCVDDNIDFAEMVTEVLGTVGYQVTIDTGKKLHHILRNEHYGLVLLDERLSWGWGSDLCLEIKQNPYTQHIPVVLVSAAQDIAKVQERCGADEFVRKPFSIEQLLYIVDRLYLYPNPAAL